MDHILKPSFEFIPNQNICSINNLNHEQKQRLENILIKPVINDIDKWTIFINNAINNK